VPVGEEPVEARVRGGKLLAERGELPLQRLDPRLGDLSSGVLLGHTFLGLGDLLLDASQLSPHRGELALDAVQVVADRVSVAFELGSSSLTCLELSGQGRLCGLGTRERRVPVSHLPLRGAVGSLELGELGVRGPQLGSQLIAGALGSDLRGLGGAARSLVLGDQLPGASTNLVRGSLRLVGPSFRLLPGLPVLTRSGEGLRPGLLGLLRRPLR